MYTHCHLCRRSLGTNDAVPTMPVGRRLAYDPERGRLWVVCPRCGEWNLTPLETRWEAIERCEELFDGSAVRVSSANVGLASTPGVDLIRIGAALRDELANWRYGPRLERRRRRSAIWMTGAGILAGGVLGAAFLIGQLSGKLAIALYVSAVAGIILRDVFRGLGRHVGPFRDLHLALSDGSVAQLPHEALASIRLSRDLPRSRQRRKRRRHDRQRTEPVRPSGTDSFGVLAPIGGRSRRFDGDEALLLLGELMPRLNWRGATRSELALATAKVDAAEAAAREAEHEPATAVPAWQHVLRSSTSRSREFAAMGAIDRLALEMAVTEELERRAMAGDAALLASHWANAEEVAGIADDMFVPAWITAWIERHRGAQPGA